MSAPGVTVAPHPLLDLHTFTTVWPGPLGSLVTPDAWSDRARLDADPRFPWDDRVKDAVRDLLRHGGFKPNGRSKPCNEYIRSATAAERFPWINAAVDATNLAVLWGGLPVSTVDLDRLEGPLEVRVAEQGVRYVFNQGGQEIDVSGLICLHDAEGPCANSVKDSQRAKTDADTTRTLTLVWGTLALPGRAAAVAELHRGWNINLGGQVS